MKQNSGTLLNFCRGAAIGVSTLFLSFGALAGGISVLFLVASKLAWKY